MDLWLSCQRYRPIRVVMRAQGKEDLRRNEAERSEADRTLHDACERHRRQRFKAHRGRFPQLLSAECDTAFLVLPTEAAVIQKLLGNPNIHLMDFTAEALRR